MEKIRHDFSTWKRFEVFARILGDQRMKFEDAKAAFRAATNRYARTYEILRSGLVGTDGERLWVTQKGKVHLLAVSLGITPLLLLILSYAYVRLKRSGVFIPSEFELYARYYVEIGKRNFARGLHALSDAGLLEESNGSGFWVLASEERLGRYEPILKYIDRMMKNEYR